LYHQLKRDYRQRWLTLLKFYFNYSQMTC